MDGDDYRKDHDAKMNQEKDNDDKEGGDRNQGSTGLMYVYKGNDKIIGRRSIYKHLLLAAMDY